MDSWALLHSQNNQNKFTYLYDVLLKLKETNCKCLDTSIELLQDMLCIKADNKDDFVDQMKNIETKFKLLKDDRFFFFHFHNLVNIKLGKHLFFLENIF
jgi:hypothetical protein